MELKISDTGNLAAWLDDLKNQISSKTKLDAGFLSSEEATIAVKNEYGGIYPTDQEFRDRINSADIVQAQGAIWTYVEELYREHLELGSKEPAYWNITPRPFMQEALNDNADWAKVALKSLQNNIDLQTALEKTGEAMVKSIQDSIKNGDWPANHPRWEKAKNYLPPLIDSGTMLTSVDYEVT